MNKLLVMALMVILSTVIAANAQSFSKTRPVSSQRLKPGVPRKLSDKTPLMISFDELKWVVLPENKVMQFAPVTGDYKKGAYTQMRRVVAGSDNGMHVHSVEITDVIISGLWYAGADMASAKNFEPGSVIVIPAGWPHVSGCRPGSDCVFYHVGKGKFDFKPVVAKEQYKKR